MSSTQAFGEDPNSLSPSGAGGWTDDADPVPPPIPAGAAVLGGPAVAPWITGLGTIGLVPAAGAILTVAVVVAGSYLIYTTWVNGDKGIGTKDSDDLSEPWPSDGLSTTGEETFNPIDNDDEITEPGGFANGGIVLVGPGREEARTEPIYEVEIIDDESDEMEYTGLSTDQIEGMVKSFGLATDDFGLQEGQGIFGHSGGGGLGSAGPSGGGTWTYNGSTGEWEDNRGEGPWAEEDAPVGNVMLIGGHSNGPVIELPETPAPKLVAAIVRSLVRARARVPT